MKPIRPEWQRKEFHQYPDTWSIREKAEEETRRDLGKCMEQLLCDVHEEILNDKGRRFDENIMHAHKRMVALMAKATIESSKIAIQMRSFAVVMMFIALVSILPPFIVRFFDWLFGLFAGR